MLNVQVETSDVPHGSLSEVALFNIFLRDKDSGIKCILSKLAADTELCAVAMLVGRDAIQRDLGRAEEWIHVNLTEFSKARGKVLHLGHDKHNYRLGGEWIESSFGILG